MASRSRDYDRMPLMLIVLLAVFLVGGVTASRFRTIDAEASLLPDLATPQFVEVRGALGRTVLSGEFRERTDAFGNIEYDAALFDRRGRRVIGEIEIEIPGPNAVNPVQELEVDIIELRPSEKHSVFVDDREVVTFTTDDRGSIDMEVQSPSSPPSDPPVD